MSSKIIYGKYLVIDEQTVIPSGALYLEEERIVDYGPYGEITAKHTADQTLGSAETLIIPGLVNAPLRLNGPYNRNTPWGASSPATP